MNNPISLASLRLGKTSVEAIKELYACKPGILEPFTISVVCTQVPQELSTGVYTLIWLGSDNSKGIPTEWKQGYKAFGRVKSINRGKSYNDESTTIVEILYAFDESINRLDFLKQAPEAYYDCSALPIIGLDDHSNQTIRMLQDNGERYDIGAMFYALNAMDTTFKHSLLELNDGFKQYFQYLPPSERHQTIKPGGVGTLLDQPLQLIYYGAPGTGKSFTIDKATNEKNSVRTTFHPDSDYAGFVGAYKPTMQCVDIHYISDGEVKYAKGGTNDKSKKGPHPGTERKIVYKYVPQAFLKAYVEAWKRYSVDEDNPYYLVIEEINRGNCAQIFGDLFQLLDRNNTGCSSYAISADEDIAQFLRDDEKGFALKKTEDGEGLTQEQRDAIASFVLKKDSEVEENIGPDILNGTKLLLPPNLRIWATMNTSDQSLFPIDSAFKRRWNWEYMPIEYDKKDWTFVIGDKRYSWGEFLKVINPKIFKLTMSEDKQMGYFFAKPDKKSKDGLKENDTISQKVFVNKVLFYLWTDVFKDYDLTEEPFAYDKEKDGNKVKTPYRFTDFFSSKGEEMLANFIDGLKLTVIGEETEDVDDVTEEGKKVILGKFNVNGGKSDTITWSLHQILRPVVGNMSYEQLLSKIKEFIPRQDKEVIKVIENPQAYTKENGWLKHYLTTADGVSFVITNQWKKEYIPMVKALADNLGIEFKQI